MHVVLRSVCLLVGIVSGIVYDDVVVPPDCMWHVCCFSLLRVTICPVWSFGQGSVVHLSGWSVCFCCSYGSGSTCVHCMLSC